MNTSCEYEVGSGQDLPACLPEINDQYYLMYDSKDETFESILETYNVKYGYYQHKRASVISKFNNMCYYEISFLRSNYHFRNSQIKLPEGLYFILYSACGGQVLGLYSDLESLAKGIRKADIETAKIMTPPEGWPLD